MVMASRLKRWLAGVDLRFHQHDEAAYKSSLEQELVRSMQVCAIVLCFSSLAISVPMLMKQVGRDDSAFTGSVSDPRTVVFAFRALQFVAGLVLSTLCWLWRRWREPNWCVDWELLGILVFLFFICTQPVINVRFMAIAWGLDPDDTWGFSSCNALEDAMINLDLAMTAAALFVPFRAVVFWIPAAACIGSIFLVSVLLRPASDVYKSVLIMVVLTSWAVVGAWRHEKHVREKWITEHKLKQTEKKVDEQGAAIQAGLALTRGFEAVLSALCDFVIKLSSDLRMVAPDTSVDSFFGMAMEHRTFSDVVAPRDHARLQVALEHAVELATPENLHLTLVRDACGEHEATVLLMALETSCPRYIIGVRVEHDLATQHAEAELKPSTKGSADFAELEEPRPMSDIHTMKESLPLTTPTGHIFAGAATSVDNLVALGMAEHWLIPASEIQLVPGMLLGSGGFGVVVGARYGGSDVAIKVPLACAEAQRSSSDMLSICNELRLLRHLRHPNVVCMYGALCDPKQFDIALVMEFLHGTTLAKFLTGGEVGVVPRVHLLEDIVAALVCMHSSQPAMVHGDLKDTNIFVEKHQRRDSCFQWRAKLLDFGLSKMRTKHSRLRGGTWNWMAPEQATSTGTVPHSSADVFSLGRVVFFVVCGSRPNMTRSHLRESMRTQVVPPLDWGSGSILIPSHRPVTEQCCQWEPDRRPSILEAQRTLRAAAHHVLGSLFPIEGTPESSVHELLNQARNLERCHSSITTLVEHPEAPPLSTPVRAQDDSDASFDGTLDLPESFDTPSEARTAGSSPPEHTCSV